MRGKWLVGVTPLSLLPESSLAPLTEAWCDLTVPEAAVNVRVRMKPEKKTPSSSWNLGPPSPTSSLAKIKRKVSTAVAHALSPMFGGKMFAKIKQTGANDVTTINGGGAFHASDKIFQHNGAGTVKINNFFASDFGKLYRGCGNCATSYERHVEVNNVCFRDGKEGVGINSNWGDTAILSNIKTNNKPTAKNSCCAYKGVAKGSEPSKIGCGESQAACQFSESAVGTC
ncbi:hypothetical protein EYR38_010046 [Pleurotus pulmonarius]|nr:hypothetical protein EYR38_010046 [Pleurotus pulmonarius]